MIELKKGYRVWLKRSVDLVSEGVIDPGESRVFGIPREEYDRISSSSDGHICSWVSDMALTLRGSPYVFLREAVAFARSTDSQRDEVHMDQPLDLVVFSEKVNVLGTEYRIELRKTEENDPKLDGASGYTEPWSHKLVVEDWTPDERTVQNPGAFKKKILRHEITHAFLHESGLRDCSWGDNEEIVDWIAYQGPKLMEAWKEAGCL